MTNYIVFKRHESVGDVQHWEQITAQYARSARAAIRQAIEGTEMSGTFVAVPVRSFTPVTVKVETKTALTFS